MTKRQAQNVGKAIFGDGPYRIVESSPGNFRIIAPMSNLDAYTIIDNGLIINTYGGKKPWYNLEGQDLFDGDGDYLWFQTEPEPEDDSDEEPEYYEED
jgi:hypothetical protein